MFILSAQFSFGFRVCYFVWNGVVVSRCLKEFGGLDDQQYHVKLLVYFFKTHLFLTYQPRKSMANGVKDIQVE